MVVYVNNAGDVKGRDIKIKISGQEIASIRYINAEKGTKFGTEILIETPEVTISATGNGTNKNDYIKGTLDVQVSAAGETHTLGTVEIDGDTKNNDFVGEITFTPSEELKEDIRAFCKGKLPEYQIPDDVEFIDILPRTPREKVDYRALEDMMKEKENEGGNR
jgi:acyl-CoA synthetase (AMP-forming)/AMP-acid ligase II